MSERFEKHARTVSVITLLSRFTGLARDATLSRVFGAGPLMDAFFFAFMVPNLFRRLFGEGALSAAFLPEYARLHRDDVDQARRLASALIGLIIVVLGVVVIVGEAGLALMAPWQEHGSLPLRLLMILLPYMPMVCVVALLGAMLQVHGKFGPTAAAPILLNSALVAAALLGGRWVNGDGAQHVALLASAVIVAGVLQIAWSLFALRGSGWMTAHWQAARGPLRTVAMQAGPMLIGLGVLQLNTLVDGLIASYPTTVGPTIFGIDYPLEQGAMSWVSYAQRLYQFPLGVFGIAIATAIFPALSRQAGDDARFTDTLKRGLRLVIFIGLPASTGLIIVKEPLTRAILQGGNFTAADTANVGWILTGYASAVWAYSATHVLTRAFYARSEAKTPVRVAVAVVALNVVLNCTLIWTPLGAAGLAWSTAICAVIQVSALTVILSRRIGPVLDASVLRSATRSMVLTLVMSAAVFWLLATWPAPEQWWRSLLQLLAAVFAGGFIVLVGAKMSGAPEVGWLLGRSEAE